MFCALTVVPTREFPPMCPIFVLLVLLKKNTLAITGPSWVTEMMRRTKAIKDFLLVLSPALWGLLLMGATFGSIAIWFACWLISLQTHWIIGWIGFFNALIILATLALAYRIRELRRRKKDQCLDEYYEGQNVRDKSGQDAMLGEADE